MQIVIDIPREQYSLIMQSHRSGVARFIDKEAMMYAIKNGTPLDEVLDKIRDEISCNIVEDDTSGNIPVRLRADWDAANKAHMIDLSIIDKYKAEVKSQERSE